MPELPEVETVRIGLGRLLPGKTIADVWHDWPKSFPNAPVDVARFMINAKIKAVNRRAKVLIIDLSSGYSLVIHLKMTGQLVFVAKSQPGAKRSELEVKARKPQTSNSKSQTPKEAELRFGAGHPSADLVGKLPAKATRVVIDFKDGSKLFFNDQRKFGWMRLIPTLEVPEIDFMKKVGPEPLDDQFTSADFIARLMRRPSSNIKAVLLDQTVVAGIGNIYADEALFAAKIHPQSLVGKVPKQKLATLFGELQRILNLSIASGGSTDRNYVDAEGKKGSYLTFAKVFRREGQECEICGTPIEKIRVAGRGTHICPTCQKLVQ